jgi:hypothetical protein
MTQRFTAIALIALIAACAVQPPKRDAAVTPADTSSTFVGKWVLDVRKSTFEPLPPPKSETIETTHAQVGGYHTSIDTVNADGSISHLEYTTANDGKTVPVIGTGYFDSITSTQVNSKTIINVFMKAGRLVALGLIVASEDGKTMEGPLSGTNSGGSKWMYREVFVRQ